MGRYVSRNVAYIAFLPCGMQFKQKIIKQISSLSFVSIAFDMAEMRRMNRALVVFLNTHLLCPTWERVIGHSQSPFQRLG